MASTFDTLGDIDTLGIMDTLNSVLNMTLPLLIPLIDTSGSIANLMATLPYGDTTLKIVRDLTALLIPVVPGAQSMKTTYGSSPGSLPALGGLADSLSKLLVPDASSMYQSRTGSQALDIPPWVKSFASYVELWGWPLLLKRIPGRGYGILADTDRMRKGEFDEPAYIQG
jgi:hypothetical protein